MKLKSWLKILSRLGKPGIATQKCKQKKNQIGKFKFTYIILNTADRWEDLGIYSSTG